MLLSYQTPYGALQLKNFTQILQHDLESVVAVVKPFPHHQLTNDVGHGVVEEACWAEQFTWRKGVHSLHK